MPQASLTSILRDVNVAGLTRRKVIRVKDATIRQIKNGYLYIDADDITLDPVARVGHSLIGGGRYTYDSTISVAEDATFNDEPVFVTTGTQHFMREMDTPNLESFTCIMCLSIPQTVIDEAEAFTLGQNYVWSVYNEPLNSFLAGLQLFGTGATAGWSCNAKIGTSGAAMNVLWPLAKPTADTPFIFAWTYDHPTTTSKVYFNDGETVIQSKADIIAADPGGGDGRYWPMSFGVGSNTVGWRGKMAAMLFSDDSVDATRMTAAQRIAIMNEWRAAYDIA